MTSTAIALNSVVSRETPITPIEGRAYDALDVLEADYDVSLQAASIKGTMKASGYTAGDLWMVDPRAVRVLPGFNARVINDSYRAVVRSIADSIKVNGYYKDCPLAGYVAMENGEQVIYMYGGHRRLEASLLAIGEGYKLERVPMTIDQVGLSLEDMTVALIQGNGGEALSFYESAITCKRLLQMGLTMDDIVRRTGLTQPLIDARMKLMSAPRKLREMVANEAMSGTLAIELMATYGKDAVAVAEEAQTRAVESGKTKILKAQVEASPYTKVVKKASTRLYEVAGKISQDPAYSNLSAETRELLDTLLAEIQKKAEAKAVNKGDAEGATAEAGASTDAD